MLSDKALPLGLGVIPSKRRVDAIATAATREAHLSIAQGNKGGGLLELSQDTYGTFINKAPNYEYPVPLGPYVLVSTGPEGDEEDGSGPVYWGKPVYCRTNDDAYKEPAQFNTVLSESDTVPVTCIEELGGTCEEHSMPLDGSEPIMVYGMYDQTVIDGTMDMRMRRFFNRGTQSQPWFAEVTSGTPFDGTPIDGSSPVYCVSEDEVANTDDAPVTTMEINPAGRLNYPVTNMSEDADSHKLPLGTKFPVWSELDKETPPKRRYFCFRRIGEEYKVIPTGDWVAITDGSGQGNYDLYMEKVFGPTPETWETTFERRFLAKLETAIPAVDMRGFGSLGWESRSLGLVAEFNWPTSEGWPSGTPSSFGGAQVFAELRLVYEDYDPGTVSWATEPDSVSMIDGDAFSVRGTMGESALPQMQIPTEGSGGLTAQCPPGTISLSSAEGGITPYVKPDGATDLSDGSIYGFEIRFSAAWQDVIKWILTPPASPAIIKVTGWLPTILYALVKD